MPTDFAFRLSTYITLALSSVCLGFAEWEYLPEVTYFTGVVVLAMIAAFVMDSRNRHLSLLQANIVGGAIFALAVVWIGFHVQNPDSLMNTLPWPAGGLPFLAPLLMLLIPAKLFRPKLNGDWWTLYGISLASVGLAMSLAESVPFMALVLVYATSAIWSLTLFYFRRSSIRTETGLCEGGGRLHLGRSFRWMAWTMLLGIPVFLATPRTGGVQWELFKSKLESGAPLDGTPDLSRTGVLKPSRDIAFEVFVTNSAEQWKLDVSPEQRWRGSSYTDYQSPRGRWGRSIGRPIIAPTRPENWRASEVLQMPDFGPASYRCEFSLVGRTGGTVYADPVSFDPTKHSPIAAPMRVGFSYAVQNWDTSFIFPQREVRLANRYLQQVRGDDGNSRDQASTFPLADSNVDLLLEPFLIPPPPGIEAYGRQLLDRLFSEGRLSAAIRQRMNRNRLDPDDHAFVAEAFREYLSSRGGFTYTLDLRRQDKALDPIEDFLVNIRSGHCERFASALVLLLRSVNIPSQFVIGYRGCESLGNGRYVVRQDAAHAWAEVLLSRVNANGRRVWYWQAFDATPASAASTGDEDANILESSAKQGKKLFADYILNLNPETQRRITSGVAEFTQSNWPYLAAAPIVLAFAWFGLRRLRKRRQTRDAASTLVDPVPWYTRLVASLHAAGLPRVGGETPQEFSIRAERWLNEQSASVELIELVRQASASLYRIRYAEETAAIGDADTISTSFQRVEHQLAALHRK